MLPPPLPLQSPPYPGLVTLHELLNFIFLSEFKKNLRTSPVMTSWEMDQAVHQLCTAETMVSRLRCVYDHAIMLESLRSNGKNSVIGNFQNKIQRIQNFAQNYSEDGFYPGKFFKDKNNSPKIPGAKNSHRKKITVAENSAGENPRALYKIFLEPKMSEKNLSSFFLAGNFHAIISGTKNGH